MKINSPEMSAPRARNRGELIPAYLKKGWALPILLLVFLLAGAGTPASKPEPIVLQKEVLPFTAKEFHIADIVDERSNKKGVAFLLPSAPTAQPIDLKDGAVTGMKNYVRQSLKQNQALRPITIRVKEYQLKESPAEKGRVAGQAKITVAFEVQREGKYLHLLDYSSSAGYVRPSATPPTMVEPMLRRLLAGSLRYLTTWVDKEAPGNEKLAHSIKVHFEDYQQSLDDDTVFYDPKRPLTWADFQGGSRLSKGYAASVFPGISNEIEAAVENGVLQIKITSKPYMLRQLSKALPQAKDDYTLNHEQRHFDIVKLVSEHYKQRLKPEKITLEDYESQIKYQYLEVLWELDKLQKQYDLETDHGLNHSAQTRWNQKIDLELQTLKVKP
ncbi:hypothetical protein [Rufibacter soli]